MERALRFVGPCIAAVLVTLVSILVIQFLSHGAAGRGLDRLLASDPGSWLQAHQPNLDLGQWLASHAGELTGIGALASGAGLVIASLGLLVSATAQRQAAFTSSWNSSRDCLWHFNEQWKSLYESRTAADAALKKMPPYAVNEQLSSVLNFFDNMAFMGTRGHLDDELAWTNYFDEASDLWKRAASYVEWQQRSDNDPTLWCEYEPWLKRLAKIDARRKELAKWVSPTRSSLNVFAAEALAMETAAMEALSLQLR